MATLSELFAGPTPNSSFVTRLQDADFTSPSGVTFSWKFDDLNREGSKKLSVQEIVDSNTSIAQDQGNNAIRYPMNIYFTGKDYDLIADQFFIALSEKYTLDKPGILNHPRWGEIFVFPASFTQQESFVSGTGVAKFDVSFVRIYQEEAPASVQASLKNALNLSAKVKAATEESLEVLVLNQVRAISDFTGRIANSFGLVSGVMAGLASSQKRIVDEIENIGSAFTILLDDVANSSFELVFQTQRLMELPANFRDETLTKINAYNDLFELVTNANQKDESQGPQVQINSVVLLETLAGYTVAQLAVAAAQTQFKTRDQAVKAIEALETTSNAFFDTLSSNSTSGLTQEIYAGSHNFLSSLATLAKEVKALLLQASFNLDIEKRIILKSNDDPVNLCYKYYDSIETDTIEYFINTNNLSKDEFIELPAGREIIIYG